MSQIRLKPEQSLQIAVFDWISLQPKIRDYCFSIPNEMKVSIAHANILKRMGRRAGVSDIFIGIPKGAYNGLFLELKANKNEPNQNQLDFMSKMRTQNYYCDWANTIDKAISIISNYLNN